MGSEALFSKTCHVTFQKVPEGEGSEIVLNLWMDNVHSSLERYTENMWLRYTMVKVENTGQILAG